MRILYLDCFSGIAGDMLLGALVDLGLPVEELRKQLRSLPLRGYTVSSRRVRRAGISGIKLDVRVARGHTHRGWREIRSILEGSDLPPSVTGPALKIFRRLIEAEARIHRLPLSRVHLHEVGAVDAIVDVVGAVIGLNHLLGPGGRLQVSPLHLGGGRVRMSHGVYPVPPPATAALLQGVPVHPGPVEGELVTPTGAAIVSTLAHGFGPMPPLRLEAVGYGAGTRKYEDHPNMLRAILGSAIPAAETRGTVVVIECTIDDMDPQGYGYLMEKLFDDGALEVFYTPVQMKKSRPGVLVTVIAPEARFGEMAARLFRESTTIGIRHRRVERIELAREVRQVRTPYGRIRVKISSFEGDAVQVQPEYEDCRRAASRLGVPLKEVRASALAACRAAEATTVKPARPGSARRASPSRKTRRPVKGAARARGRRS